MLKVKVSKISSVDPIDTRDASASKDMFQWNIFTFEQKTKPETDSNCRKVIEKKKL